MSNKSEKQVVAMTTSHAYDLANIDAEKYTPVIREVLADKAYIALAEKRTKLFRSAASLRVGTPALKNLAIQIEQIDRKMAYALYVQLVQKNISEQQVYEIIPFNQLLRYYVDYKQEGMVDRVQRLALQLDKMTFLADVLDSVLTDIKADMQTIFKGEVEFKQFDVVAHTMKQLRGFFGQALGNDPDSPAGQLFIEYADSINEYMDKRMKTYNEKHRKISPIHDVYGEEDMVRAINQFFGVENKFGHQFIKHTKAGGCYIDAMALCSNLNSLETEKLDKAVGQTMTDTNMDKYDLRVTDVILESLTKPSQRGGC